MTDFRTEHDSMGEVRVPADALWGAQTQRAVQNFRAISDRPLPFPIIRELARIKGAAAVVNAELGVIGPDVADGDRARPRLRLPAATTRTSSRCRCSRPAPGPRPT